MGGGWRAGCEQPVPRDRAPRGSSAAGPRRSRIAFLRCPSVRCGGLSRVSCRLWRREADLAALFGPFGAVVDCRLLPVSLGSAGARTGARGASRGGVTFWARAVDICPVRVPASAVPCAPLRAGACLNERLGAPAGRPGARDARLWAPRSNGRERAEGGPFVAVGVRCCVVRLA